MFDDAKDHYNWVSQVTELMSKYGIEMDDSDTRIKNKVNDHFSQTLMSKIVKALSDQRKLRTYSRFKQYSNLNHILMQLEANKFKAVAVVLE